MLTVSFLKAIFLSIVVPHGAEEDQLGPEHHKKVEIKFYGLKQFSQSLLG